MVAMAAKTKGYGDKTRWGKEPVRFQFLRQFMIWFRDVEAKTGVGTPTVRGFHKLIGGTSRISWTRFYYDHYLELVNDGYLSNEEVNGASVLVITQKAFDEIEL